MPISPAQAKRVIEAAIARAEELGIRVSIAVCDDSGRLVALNRMDGSFMAPPTVPWGSRRPRSVGCAAS
jgi:uncharacterized protein GlcG (DUF336 family)